MAKFYEEHIVWDWSSFEPYDEDVDGSGAQEGAVEGRATSNRIYTDYTASAIYTPSCQAYVVLTETIDAEGTYPIYDI